MPPQKVRHGRPNATGRNESSRYVLLQHWLLKSLAWQYLSPPARSLLVDLWRRHNGFNNGQISYSVREAMEDSGITKSVAGRAFQELEVKGFIRMRGASTFDLKTRQARTWELTGERCDDRAPTKDFMRWSPTPEERQAREGRLLEQRETDQRAKMKSRCQSR